MLLLCYIAAFLDVVFSYSFEIDDYPTDRLNKTRWNNSKLFTTLWAHNSWNT